MIVQAVLDIPTRSLDKPFAYLVPPNLEPEVAVGVSVLVPFGGRKALGYVTACHSADEFAATAEGQELLAKSAARPLALSLALDGDADKFAALKPIEKILAPAAFDAVSAQVALWISQEYGATLSESIRLFCPPGRQAGVAKDERTGEWEVKTAKTGPVDDRWVVRAPNAPAAFAPAANAVRQKAVLAAVSEGPVRAVELSADIPGASAAIKALEARGVVQVVHRRRMREVEMPLLSTARAQKRSAEELTAGQKEALAQIGAAHERKDGSVIVLDGVTGSGKTEVYLAAIERVLAQGKGAIVLVPEISLTPQTVGRFRSRFGDQVAVLHSKLSVGERFDQWDSLRSKDARVVVGARSALFAPVDNVGLIIIDEEHESSYKQGSSPRYHAREVAAHMALLRSCPLVLGSATPSLESLYRCDQQERRPLLAGGQPWIRVGMPQRVNAKPLPPVEIVDMKQEFALGHRSMFSRPLLRELDRVVQAGEKAVLLLNRRGFAQFMLCRECGFVPRCDHCSTSLTYHERTQSLECHTCGDSYPVMTRCPQCGSPYLRAFGTGTQRVEDELAAYLGPDVPIFRMDADTTKGKHGHEKVLEAFDAAPVAVLLGTQMIAKGLDFPEVTLVGVINADTTLKTPDFRASEKTFALLEQVAGRAGRGDKPGRVIIQTYWPEHAALRAVAAHDRQVFLDDELALRQEAQYPPFVRLANVLVWGKNQKKALAAITEVARELRALIEGRAGLRLLGPTECIIGKAKDNYRYHLLVKCPVGYEIGALVLEALARCELSQGINCAIDVDPSDML